MKLNKLQIIAAICLVAGMIIFVAGFAMLNFDVKKLSTVKPYEEKSYVSTEQIRSLFISDGNADIEISSSADNEIHIAYFENDKVYYDISESKGNLYLEQKSRHQWYDYFFTLNFEQPKLMVEIPKDYGNDIEVKAFDGYIAIEEISIHDLKLSCSDDEIRVKDVSVSGRVDAKTFDDDIFITNTTVIGDISCNTSSGKIDLNMVEGKNIEAENSDGRITLQSVKSNESIYLKTSSDYINIDAVEFMKELICTVTDGNVKGSLTGKLADYSVTSKVVDGKSNLPESMTSGDKRINIKVSSGDIDITFIN